MDEFRNTSFLEVNSGPNDPLLQRLAKLRLRKFKPE
jgi:hypothetical protein